MVTATRQKQLGLEGVAGNRLVPLTTPTGGNGGARHSNKGLVVGGKWKIQGDGLQIVIYHRTKTMWTETAYVSTLAAALNWLVQQELRQADLSDLKAAVERIEQLRREIIGIAAG